MSTTTRAQGFRASTSAVACLLLLFCVVSNGASAFDRNPASKEEPPIEMEAGDALGYEIFGPKLSQDQVDADKGRAVGVDPKTEPMVAGEEPPASPAPNVTPER